jgi:hypothetical protein
MPSNSFVNTIQHAKIEEAVFSVDPTEAPIDWLDNDHVRCASCDSCPIRGYITRAVSCKYREKLELGVQKSTIG